MKNTDLSVYNSILEMLDWDNGEISTRNEYKIGVLLFGVAYAAPNKGTAINTDLDSYRQRWVLQKIVEFKDFEWFSSTFQGKFNLQGIFKQALHIQVLFKPVQAL